MHRARSPSDLAYQRAERDLRRVVPVLKAALPLRRIIAFGSYARRDMHQLSDVDLILIGDFTEPPKKRMRQLMDLIYELDLETDFQIVAYTPAEFERLRDGAFLSEALPDAVEIPLT